MNAQQLKNAILQEAITGRLVPQDPNDEPASVLLYKIRKEKAKLVKEGKLKKKDLEEKPISKEEIPFEIPESWEWVRLSELLKVVSDGTHKTPNYVKSGIPFLSVQNISSGKLSLDKIKYITIAEHEKLVKRVKPQLGDILICRIGTLGKAIRITWDFEFSIFVSLGLLRPILEEIADYIIFCINSPLGTNWILNNRVGGGTHTYKINLGDIPKFVLPLPPLNEQGRIFKKIKELLPKVEEYGKAQEALDKLNAELPERLKKSILQEAITGMLVPQDPNDEPASVLLDKIRKEKAKLVKEGKLKKKDLIETPISKDEIPFEIPESWEWVRFGTITYNRDSERIPLSVDERSILEKRYDYYGASGVIDKVDKYLFDKPLLLIGEDGANLINRSTPIAFIARGKYWVNNHAHVLDFINEDLMQYMCWYINAISLVEYVTGTAQPKMNQVKMNSILVALPPLAEQHRIVAKIEELLTKIDKLKTKGIE